MAPATGFWRFIEDVHELTFPGACIDWGKEPVDDEKEPGVTKEVEAADPESAVENSQRLDTVADAGINDADVEGVTANGHSPSDNEDGVTDQGLKNDTHDRGQND